MTSDAEIDRAQLNPWRHDAGASAWVRDAPAPEPPSPPPQRLVVATWNVWFGELERTRRWSTLRAEVQEADPDVVAFQEAVPEFLARLAQSAWVQATYAVSDLRGVTLLAGYGVVLMVRRSLPAAFELHGMPTHMGRCLLTAVLDLGDHRLCVATTHLESMASGRAARAAQIELTLQRLPELAEHAVWMGDMNVGDGQPGCERFFETPSRPDADADGAVEPLVDVWPTLRDDPGFTLDPANEMLAAKGGDRWPAVRFDRVFVRSDAWRAREISRLGLDPVPDCPDVWPSDHYGLVATLERA